MNKEEIINQIHLIIKRLHDLGSDIEPDTATLKKEALELFEGATLLDFYKAQIILQNAESEAINDHTTEASSDQAVVNETIESEVKDNESLRLAKEELEVFKAAEAQSVDNFSDEESIDFKLSDEKHKSSLNTDTSLLDKLQRTPVSNLKYAIGINDKYAFMNELFDGNFEAYSRAVNELNHLEDIETAMLLINHDYIPKFKWDLENPTVVRFISLVERRYITV